ncbi:hypothetical protein EV421DRAFT_297473 [Armillaria borealis]|uniref:Uncharacterized protein n=1 Tax=Armillaria borealis TaxID=47425 RepID=A0AA39JQC2_9AGAR|nr:hypothetical protein EV421DRAFT_297473 [Armillaria borealis]
MIFIRSTANSLAKGDWWVYSLGLYLCSIIIMLIVPPEVRTPDSRLFNSVPDQKRSSLRTVLCMCRIFTMRRRVYVILIWACVWLQVLTCVQHMRPGNCGLKSFCCLYVAFCFCQVFGLGYS